MQMYITMFHHQINNYIYHNSLYLKLVMHYLYNHDDLHLMAFYYIIIFLQIFNIPIHHSIYNLNQYNNNQIYYILNYNHKMMVTYLHIYLILIYKLHSLFHDMLLMIIHYNMLHNFMLHHDTY